MSTLRSSATMRMLSRRTRPAEVRPDLPRTGVEPSTGKGQTGGRTPPRPGYARPAGGQRADHEPPLPSFPLLPRGHRGSPSRSRGRGDTPVSTADSACFGIITAGLPRRVRCLAAAQAGQDANSWGEACALANSGCLIACLTARTAARGATGGQTRAVARPTRTGRLPPLPCWSEAITRGVYRGRGPPLPTERTQAQPSSPKNPPVRQHARAVEDSWSWPRKLLTTPHLRRSPRAV
jgi:hypothetical protein